RSRGASSGTRAASRLLGSRQRGVVSMRGERGPDDASVPPEVGRADAELAGAFGVYQRPGFLDQAISKGRSQSEASADQHRLRIHGVDQSRQLPGEQLSYGVDGGFICSAAQDVLGARLASECGQPWSARLYFNERSSYNERVATCPGPWRPVDHESVAD